MGHYASKSAGIITGRIYGAGKIGNMWVISADAERPADKKVTTGEHKKNGEKNGDIVISCIEYTDVYYEELG